MATIPIPASASPDVKEAFRKIVQILDRLEGGRNVDWHGRRIINAGRAVDDADYVTLDQVKALVEAVKSAAGASSEILENPGAVLFASATGTVDGNSLRLAWDNDGFVLTIQGDIEGATWHGETIGVAFGGTGLFEGEPGGILAFTAPQVLQSTVALALDEVIVGGGAAGVPHASGSSIASLLSGGKWLTSDPASPVDGDYWIVRSGSGPHTMELKFRDSGTTFVLATLTY